MKKILEKDKEKNQHHGRKRILNRKHGFKKIDDDHQEKITQGQRAFPWNTK